MIVSPFVVPTTSLVMSVGEETTSDPTMKYAFSPSGQRSLWEPGQFLFLRDHLQLAPDHDVVEFL